MGYWEQRHGEILASANESTTSGEETAWLDGHRALEQARSNAENSYQRVSSTTLLGTMSHGAFLQAIGQFRDAVAARAVAFQTGRDAAGLATTAITTLRGSGAGAPGLANDPGTFETIAGEEVEDTAAREAAWRSGRTAYNTSVAEREEYFRQRVLAFEEGMYLSAEKYAQIDPRIPASSSPGGSSGSSGSIAPASSRASLSGYEVGGGRADVVGIDRDPGQPTEPTAPIDPTIPPPDWDGGPGPTTPVGPIEAGIQPGVGGGGGLVSGIGAGAAGIAAGLGLVRALRNGSLGGAAPATAGRGSALTRGALGRSGGASVPPSQAGRGGGAASGRGGAAAGRGGGAAAGRGGGGTGVGRNGALGRGPGAPVSGSRGTRSSLGGNPVTGGRSAGGAGAGRGAGAPAAGRGAAAGKGAAAPSGSRGTRTSLGGQSPAASRPGGAAGGAGAAGRGGAAAAGGKGAAGGTAKGKGANGVSGSRGTRTSLGAGALGGRRGGGSQEDEKPQKIELYESDDWIDDEPSGPSVLR